MSTHPAKQYDAYITKTKRRFKMENLLQLWLNPINLGILFLCITVGVWVLAHSDPTRRDK
jgi:hypothetical protein